MIHTHRFNLYNFYCIRGFAIYHATQNMFRIGGAVSHVQIFFFQPIAEKYVSRMIMLFIYNYF